MRCKENLEQKLANQTYCFPLCPLCFYVKSTEAYLKKIINFFSDTFHPSSLLAHKIKKYNIYLHIFSIYLPVLLDTNPLVVLKE